MVPAAEKQGFTADVVVVGAGPSGCAAAYDLARCGARVLLLDRTRFPRRKICAGGLTVKARKSLRYSVEPVIDKDICRLTISCRQRHRTTLKSVDAICHMVERSAFDRYCLDQTLAAGARFGIVRRIDRVVETEEAVSLSTDAGCIRTPYVIGADGIYSRIRKLTGRFPAIRTGFAVEGIIEGQPPARLTMGFDFSQVAGGYGWIFPKRDHINVGLYCRYPNGSLSRRALVDYVRSRTAVRSVHRIAGYPLGTGGEYYRPGRGRVVLVGDAAGLVEPLLGEGLFHAVRSGQLAAAAILAADATGADACRLYERALRPIQADLRFARIAAMPFYRLPMCGHLLLGWWPVRIALMGGFAHGLPLPAIVRHAYRYWTGRLAASPP
jgi:geranylgeranyl reductase family protein